jgi:thiol-disulfide isomerase/thioredoxin
MRNIQHLSMKKRYIAGVAALLLTISIAPAHSASKFSGYNFSAKTISGATFKGSVLTGKPTILWFWAPWCTVCRAESPDLVALAKNYKNKINIVGVAGLGNINDMKGFVSDTHTSNFTQLADVSGQVWNYFGVVSQPSLVFISKKGQVFRHVGGVQNSDLISITNKLIKGL